MTVIILVTAPTSCQWGDYDIDIITDITTHSSVYHKICIYECVVRKSVLANVNNRGVDELHNRED